MTVNGICDSKTIIVMSTEDYTLYMVIGPIKATSSSTIIKAMFLLIKSNIFLEINSNKLKQKKKTEKST